MAPSKRRKSVVKTEKGDATIDTTPLEKIDVDGDLTLRLTYVTPTEELEEEEDISGASIKAEADGASDEEIEERWKPPGGVDLLVSSKHLALVSPVLKEKIRLSPELLLLPSDDLDAFRVLLNIIHGRARQVPLQISLSLLRNIALIVEKYKMVEVAELYVKIWMKGLAFPSEGTFQREQILKWLCVCWVFKLPLEFRQITRQAVWGASSKIEIPIDEDYAFPGRILDKIEAQRKNVIFAMVFVVQKITDTCTHENGVCPGRTEKSPYPNPPSHRKACDSLILGSLLKSAHDEGIWPIPQDPYTGLDVRGVIQSARGLKVLSLCDILSKLPVDEAHGAHGFNKSIKKAIEKRENEAVGLDLADFLPVVY